MILRCVNVYLECVSVCLQSHIWLLGLDWLSSSNEWLLSVRVYVSSLCVGELLAGLNVLLVLSVDVHWLSGGLNEDSLNGWLVRLLLLLIELLIKHSITLKEELSLSSSALSHWTNTDDDKNYDNYDNNDNPDSASAFSRCSTFTVDAAIRATISVRTAVVVISAFSLWEKRERGRVNHR